MDEVLGIALVSLHQDMNRLDRVAMNLANATTPGYKREVVNTPFFGLVEGMAGTIAPGRGSVVPQVRADLRPGTLRITNAPLDIALTGPGYFEIMTEAGPAYTRQGNFQVDGRGRLVTAQGYPVQGRDGDIFLATPTPVIDATGRITEPQSTQGLAAPGQAVAQIKVVQFEEPQAMPRLGQGLLAQGAGMSVAAEGQAPIRQGALENSNVSSLQEMVQLMQTMRHAESLQKVAQGYDEMLATAIHKLGDLS